MVNALLGTQKENSALTPTARKKLLDWVLKSTLTGGDWQLFAGAKSDIYVNAKQTILVPEGVTLFAEWILEKIEALEKQHGVRITHVGGLIVSAVQITGAVTAIAHSKGNRKDLRGFYVRKEEKTHGTMNLLEGWIDEEGGENAVVVEDVITTGKSVLKAIRAVEEKGCKVIGVLALVDRKENHDPALERYNPQAIFTLDEIRRAKEGESHESQRPGSGGVYRAAG